MNRFVGTGALWLVAASSFTHGATAADEPLLAGVAQVDITPPPGEMMWGYSNRPQPATGKLDPLMARVLVLACGDVRAAIVTLDLGRTPEDSLLADLRERTLSKHDLGDLFVTASHTHAAPTLESLDGKPNAYGPTVIEAIDRAIDEAAAKLVPVQLGVGRGTVDIAHNRRHFLPDGRVAMQWRNAEHEPTSPVDKEFVVIRLDRADGKPLAVLLHYACHPVVLGPDNLEFSADFVGEACRQVEENVGAPCLYLQGGCGNINPYVDKTPCADGGTDLMRRMGQTLAAAASETVQKTKTADKPTSLRFEARSVPVRLRWNVQDPEVKAVLSKMYGAGSIVTCADAAVGSLAARADHALDRRLDRAMRNAGRILRAVPDRSQRAFAGADDAVGRLHERLPRLFSHDPRRGRGGLRRQDGDVRSPRRRRKAARRSAHNALQNDRQAARPPREEDFHLIEYDDVKKQACPNLAEAPQPCAASSSGDPEQHQRRRGQHEARRLGHGRRGSPPRFAANSTRSTRCLGN